MRVGSACATTTRRSPMQTVSPTRARRPSNSRTKPPAVCASVSGISMPTKRHESRPPTRHLRRRSRSGRGSSGSSDPSRPSPADPAGPRRAQGIDRTTVGRPRLRAAGRRRLGRRCAPSPIGFGDLPAPHDRRSTRSRASSWPLPTGEASAGGRLRGGGDPCRPRIPAAQLHVTASNTRTDAYGGTFENRTRFMVEVAKAVRRSGPTTTRCTPACRLRTGVEGGWDIEQTVELARILREIGVDLIDCARPATSR